MLRKFASMPILSAQEGSSGSTKIMRTASRAVFDYEPREGYIYVRSRAISSRCNDNFDEFPAPEIKKAYRTFIGKPVFVNHHNDDHRRARGFIIDAALHEDTNPDGTPDTWAEVLMEVDAKKFPKLAKAVLAGEIDRTSMGVDVEHSICSACHNKASTPADYCVHVPKMKGNRHYRHTGSGRREGILIREACYGLHFFENSLLVEAPADPTAVVVQVDSGLYVASKVASEEHDTYLHITDDPHFKPDPNYAPVNNTTMGGRMNKGLCVARGEHGVEPWVNGHGYVRPYVAEIHVPKGTDTGSAGYMGERFIKGEDLHKAKVHRLIPLDEHAREKYRSPGWMEWRLNSAHDGREMQRSPWGHVDFKEKLPEGYRYSGPDVRDMSKSQHREHYRRWKKYMTDDNLHDMGAPLEKSDFDDKTMRQRTASLRTALPGTTSDRPDEGRHEHRDQSVCATCGSDIYYVADGSPSGSWQHDLDSGAGIPHQARPAPKKEAMLFTADKKRSEMTPAEVREEQRKDRKARTWLNQNKPKIKNVVAHWDQATDDEKAQGKSWYQDAHHMTKAIAESTGTEMHTMAGLMSNYSPQTHWAANIMNAARVARTKVALGGKGDGILATSHQKKRAQKMLDGEHYDDLLKGPKTHAFAHLIEHGGSADPVNNPKVVVDRHAASVACGGRMSDRSYSLSGLGGKGKYKEYETVFHKAARQISRRDGEPVEAHQVQAATWLTRQRLNEQEDRELSATAGSRSATAAKAAIQKWNEYAGEHHPEIMGREPGTGYSQNAPEDVQHAQQMDQEHTPKVDHTAYLRRMAEASGDEEHLDRFKKHLDSFLDPIFEDMKTDRHIRVMNDLSHRYGDGVHHPLHPGKFDHDEDGDPYYEVKDPGGSGWKARDWGQGHVTINHEATEHEHDIVNNGMPDPDSGRTDVPNPAYGHEELHRELHNWIHGDPADGDDAYGAGKDYADHDPHVKRWQQRNRYHGQKLAFGETKAPMQVDTLRVTTCPMCGAEESSFGGGTCRSCGFVLPPTFLQDPDLSLAKQVDLRQDSQAGDALAPDQLDENGQPIAPEGAPVQTDQTQQGPVDPNQLDEDGNPVDQDDDEQDDEQPVDPDQLDEQGEIPQAQPGYPGDGTPDLMCPNCGFASDAQQPRSMAPGQQFAADPGDGRMEGDVCPECQQAQLMSPQDQKSMQQMPPQ